jgi:hypothetical protein
MTIFCYIDPSAGGMMLQIFLGGIVGAFVVSKLAVKNVLSAMLNRKIHRKSASDDDIAASEENPTSISANR